MQALDRRFSVAPMMAWTDRHCRYFLRGLTRRALLYTEMVTTGAILHGDRARLLAFHPEERPLALQIGGCDPGELAAAARVGADFGFDEINLNVGCPSDRVQSGRFGAYLMAEPALVAEGVAAMGAATGLPVTVKCRIGVDDQDGEADLDRFVATVAAAGCRTFVVHARKAWLEGLSPKENRDVPPLDHARVHRLKLARPDLEIVVNGGVADLDAAAAHLARVDGVMMGRAAYRSPSLLAEVDARLFGEAREPPSLAAAVERMVPYAEAELARGARLNHVTRHMLGLAQGRPRARAYRRLLSERAHLPGAGVEVLRAAAGLLADAPARGLPAAAE